jgi:hypothetical protein
MSDPNEPRVAAPAEPPPTPPPAGATARRDALVRHFRAHGARYTRFALDQAARASGYSDNDAAAAWTLIDMEDGGKSPAARFAPIARVIVLALYLGTFALFVAGSNMAVMTYGVGVPILAVALLLAGGLSLLFVGRTKVVSRNPLAALAALLVGPFILLVVVAGLCVVTTGPTFFAGPAVPGPAPAPEEGVPPPEEAVPPEPAQSPAS